MTRFLTRLFRKTAKAGVIAFAAATLTAPVFAADKPALVIAGTETTRIADYGDGTFRYELKLPAEGYRCSRRPCRTPPCCSASWA